jgi:hypothetical protein
LTLPLWSVLTVLAINAAFVFLGLSAAAANVGKKNTLGPTNGQEGR